MVEDSKNTFKKNNYYRIFSDGVIGCYRYNYFIIKKNIKLHDQEDKVISFKSEREAYNFSCKVFGSNMMSIEDIEKYLEDNQSIWEEYANLSDPQDNDTFESDFMKEADLLSEFAEKVWEKCFVKVPSVHCYANIKKQEEEQAVEPVQEYEGTQKSGTEFIEDKTEDFVGILKEKTIRLKGVKTKKIKYTKRKTEELEKLRKEFNEVKKSFLIELTNDPNKVKQLRKAGLSEKDIERMKTGYNPEGWQVHHKYPLDDGGTNSMDNLILVKNDPYHKTLTNAQRTMTKELSPGQTKVIDFPIPEGYIYPIS